MLADFLILRRTNMKKLLFVLTVFVSIMLTGCVPLDLNTNSNNVDTTYTEEELKELIQDLIPEVEGTTSYDLSTFQDDITNVIAQSRDAVIGIYTETLTTYGSGSGVIYKNVDDTYYVVTNNHVVEDGINYKIVYERNGLLFEIGNEDITLLGTDVTTDLAVLTFESVVDFPVIELADSYEIELGQFVFAIGNPLGFEYYGTVTMGVISGLTRYVKDEETGFDATLLQHDAAISPGNSGGALLDINGNLIGINNMKLVDDSVSNIGFAIPSNTVKRIVTDLEDDGIVTRPYLGILTSALTSECGNTFGVCVTVQSGGAAEAALLEDYDVIVGYKTSSMEDYLVINNFNDLKEAILNSSIGETIQLMYYRNGILYESQEAVLGIHPDD
jgi:serine protease Do